MPNNRVKTTKALQSKKGKAVLSKLHPHSRRAQQLNRIALREDRLAINKKEKRKIDSFMTYRLLWFLEAMKQERMMVKMNDTRLENGMNLDNGLKRKMDQEGGGSNESNQQLIPLKLDQLHQLITKFIDRNLHQIRLENLKRSNHPILKLRPKPSSLLKLELEYQSELNDYSNGGFVIPDLTSIENIRELFKWKEERRCDLRFQERIRMIRLFKNDQQSMIMETGSNRHDQNTLMTDQIDSDEEVHLIEADN